MMNFTQKKRVNTKHLHGAYAAMSSSLYMLLLQLPAVLYNDIQHVNKT